MKVLIIGGHGFLGSNLNNYLKGMGYIVYTTSHNKKGQIYLDLCDELTFKNIPNGYFDIVINCASVLHGGDYLDKEYLKLIFSTNILGTQNLSNWLTTQNTIKLFINCSSLSIYGFKNEEIIFEEGSTYPIGKNVLYSGSKLFQELIFETLRSQVSFRMIQFRIAGIYGNGMAKTGVIFNLLKEFRETGEIKIDLSKDSMMNFIHVNDVCKIFELSFSKSFSGLLNLASDEEICISDLASYLASYFDLRLHIINVKSSTDSRRKYDNSKLKKEIGNYNFTPFRIGFKDLINNL